MSQGTKWFGASAALLLATAALSACGGDDAGNGGSGDSSDEPLIVGAAVAESGVQTAYDEPPMQALAMAIEDINADGGILGRKLELMTEDTRSDRARGSAAGQELVDKGADLMVVACDFDYGSPAAFVAQEAGLISFTLCAQSPKFGVQGIGPFAYSPNVATLTEGAIMAEWARERGWTSSYELKDEFIAYNREVCDAFTPRFEELGGTTVGKDTFKSDDASVAAQVTRIRGASPKPDFIRLCSSNPGLGTATRQIRAAGIDIPILGTFAGDGDYWLEAIPSLSDFYYPAISSVFGDDPNAATNEFVKQFAKKYGNPPETAYALPGYALLEAYKIAVERAGTTDSEAVADELNAFDGEQLLTGPTSYTEDVHIQLDRPMHIMQIQDGKTSFLETWELEKPPVLKVN